MATGFAGTHHCTVLHYMGGEYEAFVAEQGFAAGGFEPVGKRGLRTPAFGLAAGDAD